jgi:outer membrane protein OmpA-like peptidoglycan-associated protein
LVNEKSIRLSRIDSDGYGEQKPISNNESNQGRSLNRRVEFELAKSGQLTHNM